MAEVQLAQKHWYFVIGSQGKTSLAQQYALEHHLLYLNEPQEVAWRQQLDKEVMVEGSVDLLRELEGVVNDLTLVWVGPECSEKEAAVLREYQTIGRGRRVCESTYYCFRRQLYPSLVIIYNPDQSQNQYLAKHYFQDSGLQCIFNQIDANHIINQLPKKNNYALFNFTPSQNELSVLEPYFNLRLIHVRHDRTQLSNHNAFFDKEAEILLILQKKEYVKSVPGQGGCEKVLERLRGLVIPQLVFFNVSSEEQREAVSKYAEDAHIPLLSLHQAEVALEKRQVAVPKNSINFLSKVIFSNLFHSQLFLMDYPSNPKQFEQLEQKTAPLHLFADCLKPEQHQVSREPTSSIHYLQRLQRRVIDTEKPLGLQLKSSAPYYVVTGAGSCGKTSACKILASRFGFKHIEYEPYVAVLKEKLLAPEDGEELPFAKIISHFTPLINDSPVPLLIDGLALDAKQVEKWIAANGSPHVINLSLGEDQTIKRTRKKAEGDLGAEISEEERAKCKQQFAKNTDQLQLLGSGDAIHEVNFSEPLILAEEKLKQVLAPRVYLVQANRTLAYQNLAIRHNLGYYNVSLHPLEKLPGYLNANQYSGIIIGQYTQKNEEMICQDFHWIEKNIGPIRYMAIWDDESTQSVNEPLHLQKPPQEEKPKPAEGEEGGDPPAGGQQNPKKGLNIFDFSWTKPGNQKNMSQWFLQQKKDNVKQESQKIGELLQGGFAGAIECIGGSRSQAIYARIKM